MLLKEQITKEEFLNYVKNSDLCEYKKQLLFTILETFGVDFKTISTKGAK